MQFQQDWAKNKRITALLIFCLKTEKFRLTELYGAPPEGSTNFFVAALHAVCQWKAIDELS